MPDFSQVQRRKIKRALIRHCFDQGGSWNKLHYDMRTKLKMQDNDKRLHERDPRNFCVDGIEASEPKLALYYDFLISLDQGIDLSDEDEKSNEIGLALSEFSIGTERCSTKEAFKAAHILSGKLYLSKTYHEEGKSSSQDLIHLIMCRAEKKNPFLRITEMVVSINEASEHSAIKVIENEIMNEGGNQRHKIISLHTGILCPVNISDKEMLYHGISKSPNNIPVHQIFMSFSGHGLATINQLKDPFKPSEYLLLVPVTGYPNIRQFLNTRLDSMI